MAARKQNPTSPRSLRTPGDYYEVRAGAYIWTVGSETAVAIGRQLERRWRPRWLKFVDLHGARVWVRLDTVYHVAECTELQRSEERDFEFMLEKEHSDAYKRHHSDCDSE